MKTLLKNAGYILDESTNVWLNPSYKGIAYNDGDEIETRIFNIIKNATDISTLSTELRQQVTDWPSQYHLTSARANILRPFEQTLKNANVLEIGAGCGAISRYLGECGAQVLALEGSPRRASIARSRTRDLDNITVLAEKFDQFKCDDKFDVVTLIGVLEYANLFTPGDNPALIMLQRVRQLLKPDGKLIIAIENQLGLKYFAGAPEDHFGKPMVGIEGRYGKDQAQTFGRPVLTRLLREAGFEASNFLAPFPDYKLPSSIVTEAGFAHPQFDASAFASQSVKRDPQLPEVCNFSLELAWPVVFANGLGLETSNSFLIIASPTQQTLVVAGDLAYHYSTTRYAEYCKETIFSSQDGKSISVNYRKLGRANATAIAVDQSSSHPPLQFVCPEADNYVVGKPLAQEFIDIVTQEGWSFAQVGDFLRKYISILDSHAKLENITVDFDSKNETLPGNYFDFIPHNIIINVNKKAIQIDKEWHLNTRIEVTHLLIRALLMLSNSLTRIGVNENSLTLTNFEFIESSLKACGRIVSESDFDRFSSIENQIQIQVSGIDSINFLRQWKNKKMCTSKLIDIEKIQYFKIKELESEVIAIKNSSSWKVTKPFRIISDIVSKNTKIQKYKKTLNK